MIACNVQHNTVPWCNNSTVFSFFSISTSFTMTCAIVWMSKYRGSLTIQRVHTSALPHPCAPRFPYFTPFCQPSAQMGCQAHVNLLPALSCSLYEFHSNTFHKFGEGDQGKRNWRNISFMFGHQNTLEGPWTRHVFCGQDAQHSPQRIRVRKKKQIVFAQSFEISQQPVFLFAFCWKFISFFFFQTAQNSVFLNCHISALAWGYVAGTLAKVRPSTALELSKSKILEIFRIMRFSHLNVCFAPWIKNYHAFSHFAITWLHYCLLSIWNFEKDILMAWKRKRINWGI